MTHPAVGGVQKWRLTGAVTSHLGEDCVISGDEKTLETPRRVGERVSRMIAWRADRPTGNRPDEVTRRTYPEPSAEPIALSIAQQTFTERRPPATRGVSQATERRPSARAAAGISEDLVGAKASSLARTVFKACTTVGSN